MPATAHFGPIAQGGGSEGFSADCIAALEACGFNPDDFGTYESVCKKIEDAKVKVAKWEKAVAEGKTATATPPTKEDYYNASCQSGHIRQNATSVKAGSRGKNSLCDNVQDGYNELDAPCLPQTGPASGNGTHGQASVMENKAAAGAGNCNDPYPRDQMKADEKERVKSTINRQVAGMNEAEEKAAKARTIQANAQKAAGSGAAAGAAGGSAKGAAPGSTAPKSKNPSAAQREMAAECISAFQDFKEAQMRAKAKNDAKNSPNKNSPKGYKAELARRKAEAKDKWKKASDAKKAHKKKQKALDKAKKSGDKQRIAKAEADEKLARVQSGNAASEARRSQKKADQFKPDSQKCWMEQGRRMNNGKGKSDGRVPGQSTFAGDNQAPPYKGPGAKPILDD